MNDLGQFTVTFGRLRISLAAFLCAGLVWMGVLTVTGVYAAIISTNSSNNSVVSSNGIQDLLQNGKTKTAEEVQYLTKIVQKNGEILNNLRNVQQFDHLQTERQLEQQKRGTKIVATAILSIERHLDITLSSDINASASQVERQVLKFDQTVLIPTLEKALTRK